MRKTLVVLVGLMLLGVMPVMKIEAGNGSTPFVPLFPSELVKSAEKDFGVCLEFYRTQYDYAGWVRWNDGRYIVIFQNEPVRVTTDPRPGGEIWGSDGPGVSFMNLGKRWKKVRVLTAPTPGYGLGASRGYPLVPWSIGLQQTGRASLDRYAWSLHPSSCRY